jgi:anti-sigma B factor antagonist
LAGKGLRYIDVRVAGSHKVVRFHHAKLMEDDVIAGIAAELFKLAQADEPMLAIDFCGVDFMSSAMLGKLISLQRRVSGMNGSLRLCRIHPDVFHTFKAANLDHYFMISEDFDRVVDAGQVASQPAASPETKSTVQPVDAIEANEILDQLADVLHCAESLQKQLADLTEKVLALHDRVVEKYPSPPQREKPTRKASPNEADEYTAWNPPRS